MNGICFPHKISLPNQTRWNSWFQIVFYAKVHIQHWANFFRREYEEKLQNEMIKTIHTTLQNLRDVGVITIYIYFISIYAKEFVQDLDFFQQQNKPVFPFVEGRLQQLTAFIKSNTTALYFGPEIKNIIRQHLFNPDDFYPIFRQAFQVAYNKFSAYIPNHPARSLFYACQVFNPQYIHLGDIQRKDIRHYSVIMELDNPSDSLLYEWSIYYGLTGLEFNENLDETNLDNYWKNLSVHLPILSNIALDYIWLPILSCAVKRSFSLYNSLLDSNRQNLSEELLKQLNMLYFN
ncbi:hypothetical protein RclHR1_04360018 [Rhizophagus clarus]|uniref:HAT C-terminal dimerisation domain-containing protein n=1 Tax=Rhizophagus clarus TaxID=94130 RepID=A0A2Z6RLL6_9GLOM|nr:hypothetical protein RclHR1_04360018 [Rhizophagus clarus]